MTGREPADPRRGLGFAEESALLVLLRLDRVEPPAGTPERVARALPAEPQARASLESALFRDLVEAPARIVRDAEWLEAAHQELPATLRDALGHDGRVESALPAMRGRWPCVSGRHTAVSGELGALALWPAEARDAVVERAARRALLLLMRALGPRQRLALSSVLEGVEALAPGAVEQAVDAAADETLRLITVESFRAGFARAAAGADDAVHLLDRFGSFVLAQALGPSHHVEARALAESLPLRRGRRLLRYHRRATRAPRALVDDARRLVELAMSQLGPGRAAVAQEVTP